MNNTMKSIVFIVAFLTFILLTILYNIILPVFFSNYYGFNTIYSIFMYLTFIFILFIQATVRKRYVNKQLAKANNLFNLPCDTVRFWDKILIYLIPGVITLFPFVKKGQMDSSAFIQIGLFFVFILAMEYILSITKKSMNVYITDKGIGITGSDFRIELPINASYPNSSGFYSFDRLDTYLIANTEAFIEQSYDTSVIKLKGSSDQMKQLKALLITNGIQEARGY